MIRYWKGEELASALNSALPHSVESWKEDSVWIKCSVLLEAAKLLHGSSDFQFDMLVSLTAVDYIDHFEVVYHLRSLQQNSFAVLKVKTDPGRGTPSVPSVFSVWRGADFQERETWDLMGIRFEGHPQLKRIMLWEGFPGHPLRKDFATYEQSLVENI